MVFSRFSECFRVEPKTGWKLSECPNKFQLTFGQFLVELWSGFGRPFGWLSGCLNADRKSFENATSTSGRMREYWRSKTKIEDGQRKIGDVVVCFVVRHVSNWIGKESNWLRRVVSVFRTVDIPHSPNSSACCLEDRAAGRVCVGTG